MSFIVSTTLKPFSQSLRTRFRCPTNGFRMTATTSKSATQWIICDYGSIDNLTKQTFTVPPPAPEEIRISVRAIGLNFADVFACLGLYTLAGPPPLIPGFEVCGIVDSVGSSVSRFSPGDRVMCLTRFGGYTTLLNIHHAYVQPLPEGWSFEEGAAYPAQTFTAWYALCVLGGLPSDGSEPLQLTSEKKSVLIHSAAGGVGLQALEMVRKMGGTPVCTIGSEKKIDILRERGVPRERIIVRGIDDKEGFDTVIRERALGGDGLDVVVDSVMGDYFKPGYKLLNKGGRYIVMGSASMIPKGSLNLLEDGLMGIIRLGWNYFNRPRLDLLRAMNQNRTVSCFNLSALFDQMRLLETGFDQLSKMELPKPKVGRTFAFSEAHDALKFFQTGQSVGKLVLIIENDQLNQDDYSYDHHS